MFKLKNIRKMKITIRFLYTKLLFVIVLFACNQSTTGQSLKSQLTPDDKESYLNQSNALIRFFEGTLNDLGDPDLYPAEKMIIINETYKKYFRDDKVQIEDDLDDERKMVINKDVQAYLKDVDFFFKKAHFDIVVDEMELLENAEQQFLYVKVKTTRTLKAKTIDNKQVNSTKTRYFEINIDHEQKDLKIASIYSRKISEEAALREWWTGLPNVWRQVFVKNYVPGDSISTTELSRIVNIQEVDIAGKPNIYHIEPLSRLRKLKSVNISNTLTRNLQPLRNLTNLEELKFAGTIIDNLEALKYITSLKEIDMARTSVVSLKPIAELVNLKKVDINGTKISNLNPLSTMVKLVSLDCSQTPVTDLSPLKHLKNMQNLLVAGTPLSNTSVLPALKKLEYLNIEKTKVKSLNDIKRIPNLKKLYCAETAISENEINQFIMDNPNCLVVYKSKELSSWWSPLPAIWKNKFNEYIRLGNNPSQEQLHQLVNIKSLNLRGNATINDLSPIAAFTYLKEIDCSGTGISSLEPLKNMTYLEELNCSETKVNDISPLKGTVNLRLLNITYTKVSSLEPLAKLQFLEELYASNTFVSSLKPLENRQNLKKLHIDKTKVNVTEINEFIKKHPDCFIVYRTDELNKWWTALPKDWKDLFNQHEKVGLNPNAEDLQRIAAINKLVIKDKPDIQTLEPLTELKQLTTLTIVNSGVETLKALKDITTIEEFNCSNSPVRTLQPLSNMKNLTKMEVNNTALRNIKGIENLTNLKHLSISGCKVRFIGQLKRLRKLEYLNCSNSRIFLLSAIKNLRLNTLICYNTNVPMFIVRKYKDAHRSTNIVAW